MNIRKKPQIEKREANSALQLVRRDFWSITGEEHLNFMAEVSFIRNQSIDLQSKSMEWFLYDRDLRHERINALLLVCIHRDIFLGYDKIIDIYASKYPRRMLLTNPLSEN